MIIDVVSTRALWFTILSLDTMYTSLSHRSQANYNKGVTAGAIIGGFFAGLIIIPLLVLLVLYIMKKKCGGYGMMVGPESATDYQSVSACK